MSLELAILDNTLVLRELIGLLSRTGMPKQLELFVDEPLSVVISPTTGEVIEYIPPAEPEAKEITLADISAAIIQGVKTDRAHVVRVLERFNAKKGTDLNPSMYKAFMETI